MCSMIKSIDGKKLETSWKKVGKILEKSFPIYIYQQMNLKKKGWKMEFWGVLGVFDTCF